MAKQKQEKPVRKPSSMMTLLAHLAIFHLLLDYGVLSGHVAIHPRAMTFAQAEQVMEVSRVEKPGFWDWLAFWE